MTGKRWAEVHALLRASAKQGADLLQRSIDALQRGDSADAEAVIERAREMSAGRARVEELCALLVQQARPKSRQVLPAVATLQVAQFLERVSQDVAAIGEIVRSRGGHPVGEVSVLAALADGARERLAAAVEGFVAHDTVRAHALLAEATRAEMLQRNLIESLLRRSADDPRSIGGDLTLLAVARHLERVNDFASDIAGVTVRSPELGASSSL